jgi:predicted nucleic acid-binding protein
MMAGARLFVDTGAWLAVIDPKDQYHRPAQAFYREAIRDAARFVTTNLVIAETYTLVRRRMGHEQAIRFLELTGDSHRLVKIWSSAELEAEAESMLRTYDDQRISYVDAVSFAVMRDLGISEAFAFDRHFEMVGFMRKPQTA